jgi:ATP-dependent Zn protease
VYIFRKTDPTTFLNKLGKNAKQFKVEAIKDIKTKFNDVAGMEQAKKEIT